jgi:hypothetical protein
MRLAHALLTLLVLVPSLSAQALRPRRASAAVEDFVLINAPCPRDDAHFGESLVALDFNGDTRLDLAVGAFGEGLIYIFLGPLTPSGFAGETLVFDMFGGRTCPFPASDNRFGYDLAKGQLDGDAADELVIGAPYFDGAVVHSGAVLVLGLDPAPLTPLLLQTGLQDAEWLGNSVTVGDFDGDGLGDIAAAAPKADIGGVTAGKIHIFHSPVGLLSQITTLPNPSPVMHGNYGQHLAVGDGDGDQLDDLYVSAIGNTAGGVPIAGQIYVYPHPVNELNLLAVEDPAPDPSHLPTPRIGMHIEARDEWLAVGANRKDWNGVHDAGMGYLYSGPNYNDVSLHGHPAPEDSDYVGFRTVIANVLGDATLDFLYINMNRKLMMVWDGNDRSGPARMFRFPRDSGSHWANGTSYADYIFGGYEEVVFGDKDFQGGRGRVVIWLP